MTAARNDTNDDLVELELVEPTSGRRAMQLSTTAAVWIGIVIAAIGFGLILIGWGQVAGETEVSQQLPYLVSAGLTGLGLILVGLTVINVTVKRQDGAAREQQIDQLVSALEQATQATGKSSGRRR